MQGTVAAWSAAAAAGGLSETAFDQAGVGLAVVGLDGRYLHANAAFLALIGREESDLHGAVGAPAPDCTHLLPRSEFRRLVGGGEIGEAERRCRRPDGTVRWVLVAGSPLHADGEVVGVLLEVRDVTGPRRDVRALHRRAEQQAAVAALGERALSGLPLQVLLDEAAAVVCAVLPVDRSAVLELDPTLEEPGLRMRTGHGWPEDMAGRAVFPLEAHSSQAAYALAGEEAVVSEDLRAEDRFTPSGILLDADVVSVVSVPLRGRDGPVGVLGVYSARLRSFEQDDVHFLQSVANVVAAAVERDRADGLARHQATHDPLTGLPNRTVLTERLEAVLADGTPVALLLVDLDRFKEVNDTLGHRAGDLLLVQVAGRLARLAGRNGATVVRLGGDEFAIVMHGGQMEAVGLACRLLEELEEPVEVREHDGAGLQLSVGASVGIALAGVHGDDPVTLLRHADVAMYQAKSRSAGWSLYAPGDDPHRADRLVMVAALRQAVTVTGRGGDGRAAQDAPELTLHYQPLVELPTGRLRGVEALVRWDSPALGSVPPDVFVPLAEHTGIIRPMTTWALRRALEDMGTFAAHGAAVPVAVNLSAQSLHDPGLVTTVAGAVSGAGVAPSWLQLEITESALLGDTDHGLAVLHALRDLGVRLSIDDFGTGYSSLRYLKRLPVQELKIDRTFVTDLADDPADRAIVRAVIAMGHSLGFDVVAEGVETEQVARILVELGCDVGQGYHYARPMTATALRAWWGDPV